MINSELIIDQEFKDLIPPLSDEEYEELKESIRAHGFRPERGLIHTWNNIIIDGHNRHQICRELEEETGEAFLDIKVHSREMDNLKTREDVILWMMRNQLGRRNLADAAKINMIFKTNVILKELGKASQATLTGGRNSQLLSNSTKAEGTRINTRKTMAKIAGKSEETIYRVGKIIEAADPELIDAVLTGKKSINAGFKEMKAMEATKKSTNDKPVKTRKQKSLNSSKKFMPTIALITEDVRKLAEFYLKILAVKAEINDIHVNIPVEDGSIIIYAKSAAEKDMGFDFSKYHGNGLVKFSFSVADVDAEYERMKALDIDIDFIAAPTTYPWGARSMHFRDLDGNIVCFVNRLS